MSLRDTIALHPVQEENEAHAEEVGLRYVVDNVAGFSRKKSGKSFRYLDQNGKPLRHEKTLARIRSLVIPPAWTSVWICPYANGHLQATGRDARSRKQYRYHPTWNESRNETKFEKLIHFGEALPRLRARIAQDMKQPGLGREKVLAAIVGVMENTMIRVGNECYAEANDSYGLTTLLNKHTEVHGSKIHFKFRAKSGIMTDIEFTDRALGKIIRKCQELPGQDLFEYKDANGVIHNIQSGDVNEYLKEITQAPISAKTFRTWGGTVKAAELLFAKGPLEETTKVAIKKRHVDVIKQTADYLNNTVAVCRKYYVHPLLFEADLNGKLHDVFKKTRRASRSQKSLTPSEKAVLGLLKVACDS